MVVDRRISIKTRLCVEWMMVFFISGLFGACASIPKVLAIDGMQVLPNVDDFRFSEEGSCREVYVKGRVPKGFRAFVAVAPLKAAPQIWIQPLVTVKRDGTFEGVAYLGSEKEGAGEKYNILILAHQDRDRFKAGEVLTAVPEDCAVSDPVTVSRTR